MNTESTIPSLNTAELAQLLRETFSAPQFAVPLMIWGAPGIGKSDCVRSAAANLGLTLIDVRLSQLEPTDLRGIPLHENGKVRWAPPDELPNAERDGASGVLFLDEINAALPSVAASAYQLILDRRLGAYHLPEGWSIVAAGNRLDDRGITYAMPAPLANRFMHIHLQADSEAWLDWADRQNISPLLLEFIEHEPEWLTRFAPEPEIKAFPSPRSWVFAHRVIARRGRLDATTFAHIAACVGLAAAAALQAFAGHTAEQKTPLTAWLAAPEALMQITDLSQQMDAVQAIGNALDQQRINLDEALTLAKHLPDDALSFGLIEQLHQAVGDRLFDEPAFSLWVAARGGKPLMMNPPTSA
ncbi:MAG: hypothetical protein B7Y07_06485 [Halothiobacillus sp. 24-54-40]|jgi:hypothetical protein|nr:MAG: hypothetical protein B7Y58_05360 [Halothiobacillus sp. 35-54-62]OYZ86834.1 MAG: hypothetical protein B7Y07_06485 [Halothiobacillus sp. 24-54-40]OZA81008.1 MAG: hypothetical protein B7X64_03480 [Halothiobacillus sp. 39-53-45]HQS02523.1 MoxR family ATPase [Halothiobacillus sp.]HQS29044.1 MoxR family ATPase [Halothiobacillus sp.]